MRSLKLLGLATIAAAVLTAVAGAGGASAALTQICSSSGAADGKCTTGGTESEYSDLITFTSTDTLLTTNVTNVSCHWHFTLDPDGSTGAGGVPVSIVAWSVTDCKTSGGTKCTASAKNLPYPGNITGTSLTVDDATGAGVKLECGFLINCEFLSKDMIAGVEHDGTAVLEFSKVPLTRSGGFCPSTAELDGSATATSPSGLTVDTIIL